MPKFQVLPSDFRNKIRYVTQISIYFLMFSFLFSIMVRFLYRYDGIGFFTLMYATLLVSIVGVGVWSIAFNMHLFFQEDYFGPLYASVFFIALGCLYVTNQNILFQDYMMAIVTMAALGGGGLVYNFMVRLNEWSMPNAKENAKKQGRIKVIKKKRYVLKKFDL